MRSETYEIRTQWVEPFVPKGCSRARARVVHEVVPVAIDAYGAEEAPTAFDMKGWGDVPGPGEAEIRLCGGSLYLKASDDPKRYIENALPANRKNYARLESGDRYYQERAVFSKGQVAMQLDRASRDKAVIGGKLYVRLGAEPGYKVEYAFGGFDRGRTRIVPSLLEAQYGFDQLDEALAKHPGAEVPYEVEVLAPEACGDVAGKKLEDELGRLEEKAEELLSEYKEAVRRAAELKARIDARKGGK